MKTFVALGNGFSIDFVHHLGYQDRVDLRNLFSHGSAIRWPQDGEAGFLSYRNCPYLWNLGARSNQNQEIGTAIIEDIITCANVFAYGKASVGRIPRHNDKSFYIFAYKELIEYLRYLFIHYNDLVSTAALSKPKISNWPWAKFFQERYRDKNCDEITIVTYNYDIWLERTLQSLKIPFRVLPFESGLPHTKVNILKPHGSISFCHKAKGTKDTFSIKYDYDLNNADIFDFDVLYKNLDENYLVTALIPPAGESGRFAQHWAKKIRDESLSAIKRLQADDEVLICGLSYWHVDRMEVDEILTTVDENVRVRIVNPFMNQTFNAVLTSLFSNYSLHKSIGEIL